MIDICDIGYLDPQTREELLQGASPVQKLPVESAQNRPLEAERVAKSLVADTDDWSTTPSRSSEGDHCSV